MKRKASFILLTMGVLLLGSCGTPSFSSSLMTSFESLSSSKTLREVMEEALEEIANYVDKSLYRAEQVATIETIISLYSERIQKCRDKEKIAEYVSECKAQLDLVKTEAELKAEEDKEASALSKCHVYDLMNKREHYDILYVGSSYAYYFDQYRILENTLKAEGFDVTCDELVRGSATLQMFNDPSDSLYSALEEKLNSQQYEYIFLEELSTRPLKHFDLFDAAVGTLTERIKAAQVHCETILFEVWARDEECSWYSENPGYTYASMQEALAEAYQTVGKKYDLRVSYAGQSFANVYLNKNKAVDLYGSDKSHPNINGAYLSALTHYETLTGLEASKAKYRPVDFEVVASSGNRGTYTVDEADAATLRSSVTNFYGDERIPQLHVYVWATNTGASYYAQEEMDEIKNAIPKRVQKNVAISWTALTKMNKDAVKAYMASVDSADLLLMGANMDTDLGIELRTGEDEGKAPLGLRWTVAANRYVGIAKNAKNLQVAKMVRAMLIEDKPKDDRKNVLFVGNSYTFYNDMYLMFNGICDSLGIEAKAYKVTLGSRKLMDYQSNDATTEELKEKLSSIEFSYIFLQDQSNTPATAYSSFSTGVTTVKNIIRSSSLNKEAEILLYSTWARQEGHSFYSSHYTEYGSDAEKALAMTKDLAKAYKKAGDANGFEVSYCGIAVHQVHVAHPEMTLYHTDKTHPSALTSYMVALIHCAKTFGIDPRDVGYIPAFKSFNEGDAACVMPTYEEAVILRQAAYEAVYQLDTSYLA